MKLDLEDEQRRAQAREVQLEHDATQKKLVEELETTRKKLQEVRSDPMQWQLTKKSQVTHLSSGVPVRVARAVDHAIGASVLGEWCSQLRGSARTIMALRTIQVGDIPEVPHEIT
jgi:hypothetical protein